MIGLGVGIDYSLFIVTRHRNQMKRGHRGRGVRRAIGRDIGVRGRVRGQHRDRGAVLARARGDPDRHGARDLRRRGRARRGSAALTLLPALLAILGERINSLAVPFGHKATHDRKPARLAALGGMGRGPPWLAAGVSVAISPCSPPRSSTCGSARRTTASSRPRRRARASYDLIGQGFGAGTNGPFLVAVSFAKPAQNDQAQLNQLKQQQAAAAGAAASSRRSSRARRRSAAAGGPAAGRRSRPTRGRAEPPRSRRRPPSRSSS